MSTKDILRKYFKAWIDKDIETVRQIFAQDAVYCESYGPEYCGLEQILRWFSDWNEVGTVLEWTISRAMPMGSTLVAEWHFKCLYKNEQASFNGVTVAEFDRDLRIVKLREYQSKSEHYHPYG